MDQVITSANNPTVKQIRKLMTSAKARREANLSIAGGIHLVRSFLDTKRIPELCLYAESALQNPEVATIVGELKNAGTQNIVVADSLFESIMDVHAPVGVAIVFAPAASQTIGVLNKGAVLLEDIQDPGNIGTILRTIAAAGVTDVLLSPGCASPWSPKALRAGMGAQFVLAIHEGVDLADTVKRAKVPVLATSLHATETVYERDLSQSVAWLFGNEGSGVSESLLTLNVERVIIPQNREVESLNVAASVAVCLFEQVRQNWKR